jgi:hypothetical protein
MAIQVSTAVRTGMANAIETAVGTAPKLSLWTGALPANCAAANAGTKLCELTLPSDWVTESSGVLTKSGTWSDTSADNTGDAVHYRIHDSAGTTCHLQGTVSETGGGGDLVLAQGTVGIVTGQTVTVSTWTLTMPGA